MEQMIDNVIADELLPSAPTCHKPMLAAVPIFLAHLPIYRGYPVPYFVPKDENGVYQLKYASQEKMDNCLRYHKCSVCFKPLAKKDYWFISGPIGLQNQTDGHPPMHQCCAEYSLKMCPHLFFEKTQRTSEEQKANHLQLLQKPKEFFLVKAKKFVQINFNGAKVIKYSSHKIVERYEYVDGELCPLA